MLFRFFFAVLCGLGLVLANNPPVDDAKANRVIYDAIKSIAKETRHLDEILQQWDGTLEGALDINAQTSVIKKVIKESELQARNSSKLGLPGALKVKAASNGLLGDTRNVTQDLMYMKDRFRAITMAAKVKQNLKDIQKLSTTFNHVVVKKLPRIGRGIGRKLGKKVHKVFQTAIDEYGSTKPAPTPTKKVASTPTVPPLGPA